MSDCSRFTPELTRYLLDGGELAPGALAHVRDCVECRATIRRAELLGDLLEDGAPAGEEIVVMPPAVADEVGLAVKRRRRLRIGLAVAVAAIAAASGYATSLMHARHPYAIWIVTMILFAGPLVIAAMAAGLDDAAPSPFYKRMKGRQLSGVCQGLSEAWRVPVWVVRMAFVGLIFAKGAGLILYLVLDVLLPIHPDDRPALLRFRISRWWKRRLAHG